MKITDILSEERIIIELEASNKEDAFKEMINKISNSAVKDKSGLLQDVLNREKQTTTGIGNGIAIPHAKSASVTKTSIVFARSSKGIEYGSIDEKPVHLLFLLAVEDGNNNEHIKLLSKLSKLLLNEHFRKALLEATEQNEVIDIINNFQNKSNVNNISSHKKGSEDKNKKISIVAVTACPTGIAHTYMAQEALEKAAKHLNIEIKVETNGASGAENKLSKEDIEKADGVILAINRSVETARFKGKQIITVSAQEAINNAEEVINKIIEGKGEIYSPTCIENPNSININPQTSKNKLSNIYKDLMSGVSYMLPFIVSGGILIAIAFIIDRISGVPSGVSLGSTTYLANLFMTIGKAAFGLFIPILAAFIAYSIGSRAALAAGFVGGSLAASQGSGFLGAILAGFIAGYVTIYTIKLLRKTPKSVDGIKNVLVYPVLTVLITGAFMVVLLNAPVRHIILSLTMWLNYMHGVNGIILGMILGGMMAIDMGGPFNKAAYVFAIASLSQGEYGAMAAVMVGGMTPPLAIALATTFFKNKFTLEQREAGKSNYIMGLSFITEGAIPFVASDPLKMIPVCMVGSAIAGGLSMFFGISLPSPHGGVVVMFLANHILLYFISLLVGSVVSALLIGALKNNQVRVTKNTKKI